MHYASPFMDLKQISYHHSNIVHTFIALRAHTRIFKMCERILDQLSKHAGLSMYTMWPLIGFGASVSPKHAGMQQNVWKSHKGMGQCKPQFLLTCVFGILGYLHLGCGCTALKCEHKALHLLIKGLHTQCNITIYMLINIRGACNSTRSRS